MKEKTTKAEIQMNSCKRGQPETEEAARMNEGMKPQQHKYLYSYTELSVDRYQYTQTQLRVHSSALSLSMPLTTGHCATLQCFGFRFL